MRQNVSKGSATPRLKVVVCALPRGVELACPNISFDLTIPLFSAKLIEPLREECQLIRGKPRDHKFKLFNAHVVILKLCRQAVNLDKSPGVQRLTT
jgi:hypothetical protein